MSLGVNSYGVAWYDLGKGEYLLKLYVDSETEYTLKLTDATLKDVERVTPADFFNKTKPTKDI